MLPLNQALLYQNPTTFEIQPDLVSLFSLICHCSNKLL